MKFSTKDFIYILSLAVSIGIVYGNLATKVQAAVEAAKPIASIDVRLSRLEQKVDDLNSVTTDGFKDLKTEIRQLSHQDPSSQEGR